MSFDFSNKTAIITGSGNGIGFEIAHQLIKCGANVVVNDIDAALAEASAAKLSAMGKGKCIAYAGDAGDITVIDALVAATLHRFGHIDIVVANASNTLFGSFFDFSVTDFQQIIDLNLKGPFFLAQKAACHMRDQGIGGRILLMSSTIGLRAYPFLTAYSMTKAALQMMARSLVLDLSNHGITINALAPGATVTERTMLEDPHYEDKWKEIIPNNRAAKPTDIAKACLFLLSEDSAHITGQTLVVDGGWTAVGPFPKAENLKHWL